MSKVDDKHMSKVDKADWIWMPHPGHFNGARHCYFRLNTVVGAFIVSTVGGYQPPGAKRDTAIGDGRMYETMVFHATRSTYICCPWVALDANALDFCGHNNSDAATKGHLIMCEKWASKQLEPMKTAHGNTIGPDVKGETC